VNVPDRPRVKLLPFDCAVRLLEMLAPELATRVTCEALADMLYGGTGSSLFIKSFRGGSALGGVGVLTAGDFICLICLSMNTGDSLFSLSCFIKSNGFSLYVKIRSIWVMGKM